MGKVIFWDFDGTLAYNEYMFSKALHKVLLNKDKNTKITIDDFKKIQLVGFPWQDATKGYNNELWWDNAEKIFLNAYNELKIANDKALEYSKMVRDELLKAEDFKLFEDTIEVLKYFQEHGYENVILSNHIPELNIIVKKLDLDKYISRCFSSANIGYEKPNAKIFRHVLECCEDDSDVWMVGDNIVADIQGAEQIGLRAILVRAHKPENILYYSKDLYGVKDIIR
jgi:putative hydrolase of the HAD superfamily